MTQVISGLKTTPLAVWTALAVGAGAYMLYHDMNGDGLAVTMRYRVLGIASYPIFYGAVAWFLSVLGLMWWHRRDFLRIDDRSIIIGWRAVPFGDVKEVVLRTSPLRASRVAVVRQDGHEITATAYLLSQPSGPTIANLRKLLTERSGA